MAKKAAPTTDKEMIREEIKKLYEHLDNAYDREIIAIASEWEERQKVAVTDDARFRNDFIYQSERYALMAKRVQEAKVRLKYAKEKQAEALDTLVAIGDKEDVAKREASTPIIAKHDALLAWRSLPVAIMKKHVADEAVVRYATDVGFETLGELQDELTQAAKRHGGLTEMDKRLSSALQEFVDKYVADIVDRRLKE